MRSYFIGTTVKVPIQEKDTWGHKRNTNGTHTGHTSAHGHTDHTDEPHNHPSNNPAKHTTPRAHEARQVRDELRNRGRLNSRSPGADRSPRPFGIPYCKFNNTEGSHTPPMTPPRGRAAEPVYIVLHESGLSIASRQVLSSPRSTSLVPSRGGGAACTLFSTHLYKDRCTGAQPARALVHMLSSLAVYLCIAASHYSGDYLIGFANTVDCARAMAPGAPGPARAGRISRADPTGGVFRPIRTVAIPRLFSI
jgi:hypothetical protein